MTDICEMTRFSRGEKIKGPDIVTEHDSQRKTEEFLVQVMWH